MKKPLVSILVAAYNGEQYVAQAIESALNQTYSNIEVIVVNDGSTDRTPEIVKSYLDDKRVIYFSQPNKGISGARNKAFELSHGGYITFLDSDDFYAPTKVEEEVNFLESHPECGAAYCRVLSFYTDVPETMYHYRRPMPSGNIFGDLLRHQFINPGVVMMRREVFVSERGFNPDFRDAEDWDLWRRLSYRGVKFGFINRELHYNRMHRESLSGFHNQVKMKRMNVLSFEMLFNRMLEEERKKYDAKAVMRLLRTKLGIAHFLLGEKKQALAVFRQAFRGSGYMVFYPAIYLVAYVVPGKFFSQSIKFFWRLKHKMLFYPVGNQKEKNFLSEK